jgi:hypothetical protein
VFWLHPWTCVALWLYATCGGHAVLAPYRPLSTACMVCSWLFAPSFSHLRVWFCEVFPLLLSSKFVVIVWVMWQCSGLGNLPFKPPNLICSCAMCQLPSWWPRPLNSPPRRGQAFLWSFSPMWWMFRALQRLVKLTRLESLALLLCVAWNGVATPRFSAGDSLHTDPSAHVISARIVACTMAMVDQWYSPRLWLKFYHTVAARSSSSGCVFRHRRRWPGCGVLAVSSRPCPGPPWFGGRGGAVVVDYLAPPRLIKRRFAGARAAMSGSRLCKRREVEGFGWSGQWEEPIVARMCVGFFWAARVFVQKSKRGRGLPAADRLCPMLDHSGLVPAHKEMGFPLFI